MRVLIQNRPNALTQRGGDTIVMERLEAGLKQRGVDVTIDISTTANPASYSIVHLMNFAIPDLAEALAKRCVEAGVPYVVTALYEDWPIFFNQSQIYAAALKAYVERGQPIELWPLIAEAARICEPHGRLENTFTASHSACVLATGENERAALIRDYGEKGLPTAVHHLGCDLEVPALPAKSFVDAYGIEDFVLIVGRLEIRKNQLMLLKALEESDLPVVCATGGFTYQPEYADCCRRFKRKGRTVFVERLEPAMLGAAFAACRIHALPSWYELPGLVSLEAVRAGKNVVVTDYGTARDYLGMNAFYARPDDPDDIANAVSAAYHSPSRAAAANVEQFTWQRTADEVLEVYREIEAAAR